MQLICNIIILNCALQQPHGSVVVEHAPEMLHTGIDTMLHN